MLSIYNTIFRDSCIPLIFNGLSELQSGSNLCVSGDTRITDSCFEVSIDSDDNGVLSRLSQTVCKRSNNDVRRVSGLVRITELSWPSEETKTT